MPKNILLFPNNFILDSTATDSGIGVLEVAVNNLFVAAKASAMRQAHALGLNGRNAIKNQNRGLVTLNSLLSTRSVGKYTVPPSDPTGTVGYFLGGAGRQDLPTAIDAASRVERFSFATSIITSLGNIFNTNNAFGIANVSYGYIVKAFGSVFRWSRMTFQIETIAPLGLSLFPSRYYGASLKNQSRGYACGGSQSGTTYGDVDRFSFAGEVSTSIGALLQTRNASSGFGNRFNGYIAGGQNNGSNTANTANIERFAYASESKVNIVAALSSPGKSLLATWIPGSVNAAYLMGGQAYAQFPTGADPARFYSSNAIDKFVFVGETMSLLGTTLPHGNIYYGAVGNPTRSVMAGGMTHTDAYTVQSLAIRNIESTRVWDFTFLTEVNSILGVTLTQGRYALTGLDNSSF